MNKELIVFEQPKTPIAEIFRSIRTNIQFANSSDSKQKSIKKILITSTFMGEGKSWVASNLAVSFAQAGNKVILIDADLRKGRQHKIFEIDPLPGLANYLTKLNKSGKKEDVNIIDCLRETEVQNLLLLPLGFIPENPAELFLEDQTRDLLDELANSADIIILDSPPGTMVADSIILSRLVDGILIVTEYNKTKTDALKKVAKDIKNVGGNVLGVIINKTNVTRKKYINEYYYSGPSKEIRKMNNTKDYSNY